MTGSTWNKWDLHLHSPFTHQNNKFSGTTLDNYADKIISSNISLIAITNYFFFADNELEKIREKFKEGQKNVTVLGNIEFRINQQNKDGEWINIHCIFAEHLTSDSINTVLSRFKITNTTKDNRKIYCCSSELRDASIATKDVVVDFNELIDHLSDSYKFGEDYLIAICPNGYGGYRPNKKGRSVTIAKEIEKNGHLILGRPQDRDFFLYHNDKAKPVFVCSDAHELSEVGGKYTWVKAKPTFEGLRQALIEPRARVKQTDDFTENTYSKPRFSSIKLGGRIFLEQDIQFTPQVIQLNPNMVTIIGGRGTGKSLFLDAIYSKFNHKTASSNAREVDVETLEVTLDQGDGTEIIFSSDTDIYPYLHVSQGDIKNFTQNPDDLSNQIKDMLRIFDEDFNPVIENEIVDIINKYRNFVEYFEKKDSLGNYINNSQYQEGLISKYESLISTLTNPQNKKLIEKYQINSTRINNNKMLIIKYNKLISSIELSLTEINNNILHLNKNPSNIIKVPLISPELSKLNINKNIQECENKISSLLTDNERITNSFQQQGINQDINSLLSKISEYQRSIDSSKESLQETKNILKQYRKNISRRSELILSYRSYLISQKNRIDQAFQSLQKYKDSWSEEQNNIVREMLSNITIEGSIIFDRNKFYSGLEKRINKGKFRSASGKTTLDRLQDTFCITSIDEYFDLLSGEQKINHKNEKISIENFFCQPEYFNQGGRFELLKYLYSPSYIKEYLYVNAEFEYKEKTVDKLSVGQRGTFYVCLKLATDPFGSPFVFDQPEDDLDNEFIMEQLVPLFRKIKKYRQVIIVTHNANLVVNTDAEQIIIAQNEGEVISYKSGAVEDGNIQKKLGIRSKTCDLLEGGSYAFEKRERKYGIQKFT